MHCTTHRTVEQWFTHNCMPGDTEDTYHFNDQQLDTRAYVAKLLVVTSSDLHNELNNI